MTMNAPFERAWWGIDLPGVRSCDGTYCYIEDVPPLDANLFHGDFQWLTAPDPLVDATMSVYRNPDAQAEMTQKLAALTSSAALAHVPLPEEFIRFMENPVWQDAIPSCTACTFDLSREVIPSLAEPGAHTVLFLRDQQDVLMWYLYIAPDGTSCVICSPDAFDDLSREMMDIDDIRRRSVVCADSFEEFLYRFWLENTLWFASENEDHILTPAQQAYVEFYTEEE